MQKLISSSVIGVLACCVTAGSAHADKGWEPSAFIGAHIFSDNNAMGDTDTTPKNGLALGLRLLYGFTPMFGAEAELGLVPTVAREGSATVIGLGYRVHGVAQFLSPQSRIRPLVVLGIGGMTGISTDSTVIGNDTVLTPEVGAGVKVALGKGWGVRADARLFLPPAKEGTVTTDFEITVGAYKNFGSTDDVLNAVKSVTDLDADGLTDNVDKCQQEPEDMDGFQDTDGCPDGDNDGDGVADGDDRCPDEAETVNQFEDTDGCPDEVPEVVKQFSGTIEGITFKTNSDEILSSSFKVLDRAVGVLKEYPSLSIEIQGHSDNTGNPEYNKTLSQRRADAVKAYLVKKGVEEKRLTAVGYGMEQPRESNDTPEGRAKNRRVEFQRK